MFEVHFLGTSASAPSVHRGMPGHIVIAKEYRFLIDCGEGFDQIDCVSFVAGELSSD